MTPGHSGLLDGAPLENITIIALEQAVAMPFCSFILAELGANVIKIERPGRGDVVRGWDQVARGLSSGFVAFNAGKRDIAIDLEKDEGRRIVRELAQGADVFLENFAPGVMARLGLADHDLRPSNSELIYCSLSGYGQNGPYSQVKAYDLLIQGESGILLSNGYPHAPAKVGLPITDLVGGSTAAIGVITALFQREQTSKGAYLDVGMLDSVMPWLAYFPHFAWHHGDDPPRTGMRHQYLSPYGPFLARDDVYVNLVVANDRDWAKLCASVLDTPELARDERFATVDARRKHREQLETVLETIVATQSSVTWFKRLDVASLPFGHVRTVRDVLEHPQLIARKMFVEAPSPVGELPLARFPLAPPLRERRIPGLGEHTTEILSNLGYNRDHIAALRAGEVVG